MAVVQDVYPLYRISGLVCGYVLPVHPKGFASPPLVSSFLTSFRADTFLYGFLVPILSYMLEVRLKIDPSQTQSLTSSLLAIHGFMTLVAAPIIAHFADKTSNRRMPLLIALVACAAGTVLVACTPSRKAPDSSAFQDFAGLLGETLT